MRIATIPLSIYCINSQKGKVGVFNGRANSEDYPT
jgi:hypothetical protein